MTRILHVWDQAGVSCVLAKYQRRLGHKVEVIKRAGFDPFGIMDFYSETTIRTLLGRGFLKFVLKKAKDFDVIHIHDLIKLVPQMRSKFNDKAIILHYHGSILIDTKPESRKDAESSADTILVSTPDLLKYVDGTYLENPVDMEHFSRREIKQNNQALSLMTKNETKEDLENQLTSHGYSLNLNAIPRNSKPVPYSNLPEFLEKYEYLVDMKFRQGKVIQAFSLLGLQAVSLGLKVINHKYKITQELPKEHFGEKVVEKLMKIYHQ